ncbi:hypothetical protein ASZ90_015038 [hydrocarbon metagenome]|uniref:Uncharacterized protein n=1 Tax=hydrocarbon metagenome TaxID=938273 RepID=A0A0W8F321_9ZZZZ
MSVKQHAVQGESEGYGPKRETAQLTAKAVSNSVPRMGGSMRKTGLPRSIL